LQSAAQDEEGDALRPKSQAFLFPDFCIFTSLLLLDRPVVSGMPGMLVVLTACCQPRPHFTSLRKASIPCKLNFPLVFSLPPNPKAFSNPHLINISPKIPVPSAR